MPTALPSMPASASRAKKLVASERARTLLENAADLERRHHESVARLREHDARRKAPKSQMPAQPVQPQVSSNNEPGAPLKKKERGIHAQPVTTAPQPTARFDDQGLWLTRKEQSILNRLALDPPPAERQKLEQAFAQRRHLRMLQAQRAEAKRLRKEAALRKAKANAKRWWHRQDRQSSGGSSLFGGVKYSHVRVFQGGLPGLGKSR